jgi:DNA end-binding protein Ku
MASTVWRGHLAFGLVSFPVRLHRAARAEKISFRRLFRPAAPVREAVEEPLEEPPPAKRRSASNPHVVEREPQPPPPEPQPEPEVFRTRNAVVTDAVDEDDEPVTRDHLVKGYEYEKGQYVVVEDEELRNLRPTTSKEMEIVEFVSMAEIDPIFLETSYYVTPDEPGERPYSLLFQALRETGYVGLGQLAMHSREHVVVLRPARAGIVAHTMFYPEEVRRNEEFRTDVSAINAKELDLAKRLIENMVVPFEPEKFRDTYRERVQQMIETKIAGRQVSRTPAAAKRTAAVVDIMQALQDSLNLAKKPATSAPPSRKPKTRRAG